MKIVIVFLSLICLFNLSFSQQDSDVEYNPAIEEGGFVVSAFAGFPNWGVFSLENHFQGQKVSNGESFGIIPLSLELEYFFSNRISGTLSGIYNTWGGSWTELDVDDIDGFMIETEQDYEFSVTRLRILLGINYHYYDFGIDNFDLYAGLAIGANSLSTSQKSTQSNWRAQNDNFFHIEENSLQFPIAYRLRGGFKLMIVENIGLNFEVGIGGPTFNMGINYKL